jgi:hypothetical protein
VVSIEPLLARFAVRAAIKSGRTNDATHRLQGRPAADRLLPVVRSERDDAEIATWYGIANMGSSTGAGGRVCSYVEIAGSLPSVRLFLYGTECFPCPFAG